MTVGIPGFKFGKALERFDTAALIIVHCADGKKQPFVCEHADTDFSNNIAEGSLLVAFCADCERRYWAGARVVDKDSGKQLVLRKSSTRSKRPFKLSFELFSIGEVWEWRLKLRSRKYTIAGSWQSKLSAEGWRIHGDKRAASYRPRKSQRVTDVLKSLAAAGIPSEFVLVEMPYPSELGPMFDEVLNEKA